MDRAGVWLSAVHWVERHLVTAQLSVSHIKKSYAGNVRRYQGALAVDDVSFDVEPGQMFTLLGPSGCGKTTTLRCIAGLETPDLGTIVLGGRTLWAAAGVSVSPNDRGIGMVFQSYAIWPHMSVYKNVAFPLEVRGHRSRPSRAEIRRRVEESLATVQLDQLASRPATALSGGQQQRLALARALVMEPALLLLDEPLSNLDAKLREKMRFELKGLQSRLGITALYVTHDQAEALTMSDVIAVMHQGKVAQEGTPREIYERPASRVVAEFIGTTNIISGTVSAVSLTEGGGATYEIATPAGPLAGAMAARPPWLVVNTSVLVAIRPECVNLDSPSNGAVTKPNRWPAKVVARAFAGEAADYVVGVPSAELKVRCSTTVNYLAGDDVVVCLDTNRIMLLPAG
jgi:iron(III) transport system ATP-binding protein